MDRNTGQNLHQDEEDDFQFQLGLALSQSELEASYYSPQHNTIPGTLIKTKEDEQREVETALAISLAEAENKKKQDAAIGLGYRSISRTTGASYLVDNVADQELARYLNRNYWEQKSLELSSPDPTHDSQYSYGWRICDSPNAYQLPPPPQIFNPIIIPEETLSAPVVNRPSLSALQNNYNVRQETEFPKTINNGGVISSPLASKNYSVLQPVSSNDNREQYNTTQQIKDVNNQKEMSVTPQNSNQSNGAPPSASFRPPSTSDISNGLLKLKKVSLDDKKLHNGNKNKHPPTAQIKFAPVFHRAINDSNNNVEMEINNIATQNPFRETKSKNNISHAGGNVLSKPVIPKKPVVPPKNFKTVPFANNKMTSPPRYFKFSKNDGEDFPLPPPPDDFLNQQEVASFYSHMESDLELPPPPPPDELDEVVHLGRTSVAKNNDSQIYSLKQPVSNFNCSTLPNSNQNLRQNSKLDADSKSSKSNFNQNYTLESAPPIQFTSATSSQISHEFIQNPSVYSDEKFDAANPNIPKPPPLPPLFSPSEVGTINSPANSSRNLDTPGTKMTFGEDFGKMILGARDKLNKVDVGNGQRKSTHDPDLVSVLAKRFLSVNDQQNSIDDDDCDDDESEWEE